MGGDMLSKSLIQFSVDGWSCVPSLLFIWGQTIVEVMKIMVTSLKRSQACTATVSAPNSAAGHHRPTPKMLTFTLAIFCLITSNLPWFMDLTFQVIMQYCSLQHWALLPPPVTSTTGQKLHPDTYRRLPDTHRQDSSGGPLFLFPGCTRFCCALQESISQSYVSSGLNANSPILPSCWDFSFALRHGVSPHSRSSAFHLTGVSLTLDVGYLRTAAPVPTVLLGFLWPWTWGISSQPLQCVPSYWGFSDLGHGVSPHSQSSTAQLPLLTLDVGYLSTAAPAKCRCRSEHINYGNFQQSTPNGQKYWTHKIRTRYVTNMEYHWSFTWSLKSWKLYNNLYNIWILLLKHQLFSHYFECKIYPLWRYI